MGFGSYEEDIQKRFEDSQLYFRNTQETLNKGLRNIRLGFSKNSMTAAELAKLQKRIEAFLAEMEEKTTEAFERAMKKMEDPRVKLVERLGKREGQLSDSRKQRDQMEVDLAKSRDAFARLQKQHQSLLKSSQTLAAELSKARDENARLQQEKDDREVWSLETAGVRKHRK